MQLQPNRLMLLTLLAAMGCGGGTIDTATATTTGLDTAMSPHEAVGCVTVAATLDECEAAATVDLWPAW